MRMSLSGGAVGLHQSHICRSPRCLLSSFLPSAVVSGAPPGRATGGPSFPVSPADLKPGGAGTYKLAHEWDTRGEQFGSDNGLFFICIARCSTPAVSPPLRSPASVRTVTHLSTRGRGPGNVCRETSWSDGGAGAGGGR